MQVADPRVAAGYWLYYTPNYLFCSGGEQLLSLPRPEPPGGVITSILSPPSGRVRIAAGLRRAFDRARVGQPVRYKWDGTLGRGPDLGAGMQPIRIPCSHVQLYDFL